MALDYTLDVSSKVPVPLPSPPWVDSWARGGCRSKRRAGSTDATVSHQSEEHHLALCLLMLSHGVRGDTLENNGSTVVKGVAAVKASSQGYECSVCDKVYASYQALGGHKTSTSRNCRRRLRAATKRHPTAARTLRRRRRCGRRGRR
jgi:hypothetical protein